jgi:hypothetical protein
MARLLLALFALVILPDYGMAAGGDGAGLRRAWTRPPNLRSAATVEAPSRPPDPQPTERATKAVAAGRAATGRALDVDPEAVFARVGGVALVHPAKRVERVGFHQASDVKSLNLTPATSAIRPKVLPSRHRPTPRYTAADVVVDPRSEILSPVSGIVKRAGEYSLYCKYSDAFAVISPDGHPELEVKILHMSGRRVRPGDRVVAGITLLAMRPTKFPFGSQVDAFTAAPAWPHVHIEVTRLDVPSATPVTGPSTLAFSQCG